MIGRQKVGGEARGIAARIRAGAALNHSAMCSALGGNPHGRPINPMLNSALAGDARGLLRTRSSGRRLASVGR